MLCGPLRKDLHICSQTELANYYMADSPKPSAFVLIQDDPWLAPYEADLQVRYDRFQERLKEMQAQAGSLTEFASGHLHLGFTYDPDQNGWHYREWAPQAQAMALIGEFNGWDRTTHPMTRNETGVWELFVADGEGGLTHEMQVKVSVTGADGSIMDRVPAYIIRTVQDPDSHDFAGQIWHPEETFTWEDKGYHFSSDDSLLIYECHPGMGQEKEGVGTWREFADVVLPRIHRLGYNALQMMAVQEHPYYGSFGYHVSSFFAPSSRFGTPEDLKYLINEAHKLGVAVIMDIVHSHAVKNLAEGLNRFDGSGDQYFHSGGRGEHSGWDSKLFNYGKWEVQQFLLSNVRYWLEEYHFDGFRFDGVTSMLYFHHGDISFDHYDKYFKDGVEWDAITYLQLANTLIKEINPNGLSIAEDMSGMPGACRKVEEGGLGFDYRLGMGIPDYWIKLLKHKRDEEWSLQEVWHTLNNRRYKEKTVAYAESHDQALVGDKTLAFWLMDKEMYWHMQADDDNLVIDRGMAMHKLIRLLSASLGGEAYLNFMGNEFGHPEWIDFPRYGNNWSYKYARRQWSLADRTDLKYHYLQAFDQAMLKVLQENQVMPALAAQQLNVDDNNQVLAYERNNLIFVVNLHPTRSIADYAIGVPKAGEYELILNSDDKAFGGHGRIDAGVAYLTQPEEETERPMLRFYATNRTYLVFRLKSPAS